MPQAATRTKAAAVARPEGATDSAAVSVAVLPGFGPKRCRCSKADNKNVKSCAASKGTACTLDACRDKCAAHKDFVCAWYAHDPAKHDCYLYETCKNEAADPDYTQYLLAPTPAAVAGAWPGAPIWHVHSEQHRRTTTTTRTSFFKKKSRYRQHANLAGAHSEPLDALTDNFGASHAGGRTAHTGRCAARRCASWAPL